MVDEIFLSQAIARAWEVQTLALPNPSVGALILSKNFELLALEAHCEFGSMHAELKACKEAFIALSGVERKKLDSLSPWELYDFLLSNHQGLFKDCILYCTLEPCLHEGKTPSCAKLLSILKPKKIIFGAKDPTFLAQGGAKFLQESGIELKGEVCLKESLDLLYPFLVYQKKGRFNLFKIAQRLNGSYKNGQISNLASKIFTHTQRSNADSLIVSGNTIRTDFPKLDTRFSLLQNKAPKIQILTQSSAPTQSINAKDIRLCQSIDALTLNRGLNIVEGGYPLLLALQEEIDALLLIIAPFFEGSNAFEMPRIDFSLLYSLHFSHFGSKDTALWFKPKDLD